MESFRTDWIGRRRPVGLAAGFLDCQPEGWPLRA